MPKTTIRYKEWLSGKLSDPRRAARYLNAARKDSPEAFFKALRKVAESRQMAKVAEEAGVSRESLYRMTSETGNPTYNSFDGILRALGLDLSIVPLASEVEPQVYGRRSRSTNSSAHSRKNH
jgi:probable addiction module antidote protein